jgi:Uma2 family endonuclease
MSAVSEIIDKPLTCEALSARFRSLCSDPLMANVPGKIELDIWGRILMSPASNFHGVVQLRVARRLDALSGTTMVETSVLTDIGVLVADVAWGTVEFMQVHGYETPYAVAPAICIEIASPSNSTRELQEKIRAYLTAGAAEAWVLYPQSKRIEIFSAAGPQPITNFGVDLTGVFD